MKCDFGESVPLAVPGENGRSLSKPCVVVGITCVENVLQGEALNVPPGSVLYTVEFGDGLDALVPESALMAIASE
jgi:hypothetical protein